MTAEKKTKPKEGELLERQVLALERIAGALEAELGARLIANALKEASGIVDETPANASNAIPRLVDELDGRVSKLEERLR